MTRKFKILYLEDVDTDAVLVERQLQKGHIDFELLVATNRIDFIKALKEFNPEVVLADHSLPTINSFDALDLLDEQGLKIPMILITANLSEELVVEIMKAGAYDYILKDRLQRLPQAVANAVERCAIENERQKYLEKMIASEARYRQIVETAQEGVWLIDENDNTNFVNKKMCEIIGYTPDELMGRKIYSFMPPPYNANAFEQIERRKKGISETHDSKFITKSGKHLWTNISTNPVFDETGKYRGALAMVTDITSKKRYEESLLKSEANIRTILENANTAYILLDIQFNIVSFNQLAVRTYLQELGRELLEGENLLDYFHGERKADLKKRYQDVLTGVKANYEVNFLHPNGKFVWYNIQLSPVFDELKNILGFVIAATDITARKETELQNEKITNDLVQRNNDLEQFAYIVSHNLRAPVANIIGISNILKYPNLSQEKYAEVFEGLARSAEQLDYVIIDLNYVLQIQRELNEKKVVVNFSELVTDIQLSISNQIDKEQVEILADFNEIDQCITLKSYMWSIFYNLISNSIKYRKPEVNPKIEIKSKKCRNAVELTFKDNGMGIDLKRHGGHFFGLYKRFHSPETNGRGIGLFMVKKQIEALGGTIGVVSEVNKGTEFKIKL